jgi:hypothetical protein
MNRPTIFQGIGVAALLAVTSLPLFRLLRQLFADTTAIKVMSVLLCLAYLGYLLGLSRTRAGKISLAAASVLLLTGSVVAGIPAAGLIVLATALIWTVRTLTTYRSLVSAVLDGLLNLASLGAGLWAYGLSGSFAAGIWCFFLIQALFGLIPERLKRRKPMDETDTTDDRFARAHRSAETALHAWMRKSAE